MRVQKRLPGDWTYTPSSTVVNEVRFGYAHYYQTFFTPDATDNPANYNFNGQTYQFPTGVTNPLYFGAPRIRFKGFYSYPAGDGIGGGWPKIIGPDGTMELTDQVSIIKGSHAFKFGGEYIYNTSSNDETANAKSQLRFNSLTDFFEGNLSKAFLFTGDAERHLYNNAFSGFLQDDWRVTHKLTLNLGIRYELNGVVHERDGLMGNFDPTIGIYQTNNPYHGDHNNFSPRLFLATSTFACIAAFGGNDAAQRRARQRHHQAQHHRLHAAQRSRRPVPHHPDHGRRARHIEDSHLRSGRDESPTPAMPPKSTTSSTSAPRPATPATRSRSHWPS